MIPAFEMQRVGFKIFKKWFEIRQNYEPSLLFKNSQCIQDLTTMTPPISLHTSVSSKRFRNFMKEGLIMFWQNLRCQAHTFASLLHGQVGPGRGRHMRGVLIAMTNNFLHLFWI